MLNGRQPPSALSRSPFQAGGVIEEVSVEFRLRGGKKKLQMFQWAIETPREYDTLEHVPSVDSYYSLGGILPSRYSLTAVSTQSRPLNKVRSPTTENKHLGVKDRTRQ